MLLQELTKELQGEVRLRNQKENPRDKHAEGTCLDAENC